MRLIQVKNVFGRGRLTGTSWDATSNTWKTYMDVFEELGIAKLPPYTFWIEYSLFTTLFDHVVVAWWVCSAVPTAPLLPCLPRCPCLISA